MVMSSAIYEGVSAIFGGEGVISQHWVVSSTVHGRGATSHIWGGGVNDLWGGASTI